MEPEAFVKTAWPPARTPTERLGVLLPWLWKREDGEPGPISDRARADWVAKGSDIRKSPRLTQGSALLQSQAVHSVSVNVKQVPKSFLFGFPGGLLKCRSMGTTQSTLVHPSWLIHESAR